MAPDVPTAWFDLEKLVLAAVCGFVLGIAWNLAVYFILNHESRLRLLGREGKRQRFWKDFFEIQASLPLSAKLSDLEITAASAKCKQDLDRSYAIVMGHDSAEAVSANTTEPVNPS